MIYERLYSPDKYASLGNDARIDECIAIAEAATNWSKLFPAKKDCMRETAVICRTAMKLARRNDKAPDECLEEAADIRRTMEIEEVIINIRQFLPERCAACQRLISSETERITVELEKYTQHERVWLACSKECATILEG
jgi:hypothetical protein